jgi:GNAT superfamily N-acetyltransferase
MEKRIMLKIYPVKSAKDVKMATTLFAEFNKSLEAPLPKYRDLPQKNLGPILCTLIANCDGVDIGCVKLREESDKVCIMVGLYVKPRFRGKKIGKSLAKAIIKCARQIGYDYMRLVTYKPLDAAIKLYESLGFEKIDRYIEVPVELEDLAVSMELKLL